ncbi:MAG TPA: hypothetical protein VF179_14380 [Thermoanaerobaculia bacterium]|nr:hypothetical protein [Thermoanaerobaculia bacterium]
MFMHRPRIWAVHVLVVLVFACYAPNGAGAESDPPPPPPIDCSNGEHTLLLQNNNVALTNVRWRVPSSGAYGCGNAVAHRQDTGHFWFFDSENLELTCKALDGTPINGQYWIFCGALTNVEWWMDAVNNANPEIRKTYYNPPGKQASFADVAALVPAVNRAPLLSVFCGRTWYFRADLPVYVYASAWDPDGDSLSAEITVLNLDYS